LSSDIAKLEAHLVKLPPVEPGARDVEAEYLAIRIQALKLTLADKQGLLKATDSTR
jgi:hypothetical protein